MSMDVGVRVVRGPDWKWGNQDDGEGHVGTVVEIGKPASLSTPDKTVVVQWDSGSRTNYRIGYQGSYDLRVFDNAPIGIRHPNIICNACKKHGVAGKRWKCITCLNYDLCTNCYMNDKHDLSHVFARFETSNSIGIEMPPRSTKNSVKLQTRGIFVGARVVRGYDWDWGNQDGGEGKVGKVIDIRGWDNESRRSVANVMWASGSTNVYRLGHKGKVDLKYVIDSPGGFYYKDHLPVLGQPAPCEPISQRRQENLRGATAAATAISSNRNCLYNVGDKVKVVVDDENDLKSLQEGHGGWNPRMAQFIGEIGTVHRVTDRGDIRVQFEGCHNRWTFNPEALVKVTSYSVGDIVRVIDDSGKVKELQKSHGEWIDQMKGALGKMGKVVKVYDDGDLRVTVDGQTWTFNPLCVALLPGSMLEMNNTMLHHQQREDLHPRLGHFLSDFCPLGQQESSSHDPPSSESSPSSPPPNHLEPQQNSPSTNAPITISKEALVRESAQGRIEAVGEILKHFPDAIDFKSSGKTALQVASHQGHQEIVKLLLNANATLDLKDDEGDTALHYAAFGNQAEIIEILLKKGANIDTVNKTKCSPLHIAVNKGHLNCVKTLIKFGCNVNLQDSYGDTALHDAIGKAAVSNTTNSNSRNDYGSSPAISSLSGPAAGPSSSTSATIDPINNEIIELLTSTPRMDFTIKNKRGFNILHHACLKGNNFATERLISRSRQLVDLKKEDGFSAIHLAALNGHNQVAETLIIHGQANVDIINNRFQTPLHLAVSQSHCAIIELLVSMGANTNSLDEDNDTPLHVSLFKWSEQIKTDTSHMLEHSPAISDLLSQLGTIGHHKSVNLGIACYLIQDGNAEITTQNRNGKTPLDLLEPGLELLPSSSDPNIANYNQIKEFLLNLIDIRDQQRRQREEQEKQREEAQKCKIEPLGDLGLAALRVGDIIPLDLVNDIECIICNEIFANVQFSPCFHQICCQECCAKMKKCIVCQKIIGRKVIFNRESGQIINIIDTAIVSNIKRDAHYKTELTQLIRQQILLDSSSCPESSAAERVKYLESKIAEIEEANSCGICMERVKNVVFLCGHGACVNCAQTLKTCHMCRKTITKKINIY